MVAKSAPGRDTHLFVLVHGLWGGPNHMLTIEKSIHEVIGHQSGGSDERIATIRPSSFRFWKTYDGLRLNAERVISDVLYEIELIRQKQNSKVTKISFVGYSLGGLISRYAIGMLNDIGFFDEVKPVFFTTFATPHVGIHFFNGTIFDKISNRVGHYLFGKTGKQMFIEDDDKILVKMVEPDGTWFKGLAKFEKHVLLANIKNDRTVAFFTSYLSEYSPFEEWDKVKIKYLKSLPTVKIGKIEVRPKFVDFERSHVLEATGNEFENIQEETSWLRRNKVIRFTLIFVVTLLILPIWIPFVLCSTAFASAYSAVKVLVVKHPEVKSHWERVYNSVYGELGPIDVEDAKIGQKNRDQRRKLRHAESFKGDTSDFTESAMTNFIYAEERLTGRSPKIVEQDEGGHSGETTKFDHDDIEEEDENEDEDRVEGHEVEDSSPETKSFLGSITSSVKEKIIDVNIEANDEIIGNHLEKLHGKDLSKFPLFTPQTKLKMDENRKYIIKSLNTLDWIKVPVYIDAWNAHDGIVARRGPRTNPKGTATILLWASILRRHLMETTNGELS
ncbi:lipid droplet phospholipase 1 [[Candida] railenensis]|uniref:Lipid droplet phospholipase 1 n=1 Tax=[Candida] railenensis TaxID=45579 RepID=A0A9P0QVF2_9ASCO|nr:lipid droplet phospholipase 1 [[Candida] railenensis]